MELTFIAGRAGSKKTTTIMERVMRHLENGERAMMIVPEQFTFECEKMLASRTKFGMMGTAVHSFMSLADSVLRETGDNRVFLSHQGKRMVVRRVLDENESRLKVYGKVAKKHGMPDRLDRLFMRFKRFVITPELLLAAAKRAPEALRLKLEDLALIYEGVEKQLESRYMDSEDKINALIERLSRSSFCGMHVYVDGFEFLTEQKYRVMDELMSIAGSMTVSVCMDPDSAKGSYDIFSSKRAAYLRLVRMAEEHGLTVKTEYTEKNSDMGYDAALCHLEKHLFAFPPVEYEGRADNITVYTATDIAAETDAVCDYIVGEAKRGVPFSEMAVIMTDPAGYSPVLGQSLQKYGIPAFVDIKTPLTNHPIAELLLGAMRCITGRYAYDDIMSMVKTGLVSENEDVCERFENHLLKFGIKNERILNEIDCEDGGELEALRRRLVEPMLMLKKRLEKAKDAAAKTEALYDYLADMDVYDKVLKKSGELRESGLVHIADTNDQAWQVTLELMDQIHAIFGDTAMSSKRFLGVLEQGFSSYEIGIIPSMVDCVLTGDVERTCAFGISRLFVLGCREGLFPKHAIDNDIMTDDELEFLKSCDLSVWENSGERANTNLFSAYSILTKAKDKLWLSYTPGSGDDKLPASSVLDGVRTIFKNGIIERNSIRDESTPNHTEAAARKLVFGLRRLADTGTADGDLAALYRWYASNEKYKDMMAMVENALFFRVSEEPFGSELAAELYGKSMRGSASRLETYNACPFKHFMSYGLRLRPREEFTERKTDEGKFYHDALDMFIKSVLESETDFAELTEEDVPRLLNPILDELEKTHNNGIFLSSERLKARCGMMKNTIRAAALATVMQIARGEFRPLQTEIEFGENGAYPPLRLELPDGTEFLITGKIDRADSFFDGEKNNYRIIDYKSGGRDFMFSEMYNGLQLQLPLYVAAMLAADEAACAAGLYYMGVRQKMLDMRRIKKEELKEELFKSFMLQGVTVNRLDVIDATERFEKASNIIDVKKKDGGYTGSLVSPTEMEEIVGFAKKKAAATLQSIMQGNTDVRPKKTGDRSQCTYCDFGSICMYDEKFGDCSTHELSKLGHEEFFEIIAAEEEPGE